MLIKEQVTRMLSLRVITGCRSTGYKFTENIREKLGITDIS
jgi:hypothetical protein